MPLLACGQFRATNNLLKNLASCTKLIHLARISKAAVIFLPEASDYIAGSPAESVSLAQPVGASPFVAGLKRLARESGVAVCVGVHDIDAFAGTGGGAGLVEGGPSEELRKRKRVRNVCLYIDEKGEVLHRYQKVHVFDVDIEGGPRIKESATTEPGNTLTPPFPLPHPLNLNLGLQICFDLRFPEPAISLRRQGAHILCYPSAFTIPTGRVHWEVLLRARAIESQSYVIAPALVGVHVHGTSTTTTNVSAVDTGQPGGKPATVVAQRASWGESLIISPWGEILARCESYDEAANRETIGERKNREGDKDNDIYGEGMESICFAEVERDVVERIRREVPLLRRFDVYPEV